MSTVRKYECIGGPLCGDSVPTPKRRRRFAYLDPQGIPHFYKLIKVATNDHKKIATFYHYFGTNPKKALRAHPRMLPPQRLYKKVKP